MTPRSKVSFGHLIFSQALKFRAMSESKWTRLDECLTRIRSNEESSFVLSDWYYLPNEDVIQRLGAVVRDTSSVPPCTLRSLHVGSKHLFIASSLNPVEFPLLEYLRSHQCGLAELKLDCGYISDEIQALWHHIPSLAANRSITRLQLILYYKGDSSPFNFIKHILDAFAVRPLVTLLELELDFACIEDDDSTAQSVLEGLSVYFQSCPTNLKTLCLSRMRITTEICEFLFLTLGASTSDTRRAETVKFAACKFEREANNFLAKLMESEKIHEGVVEAGVVEVSLGARGGYIFEYCMPPCLDGYFRIPHNGRIRVAELTVSRHHDLQLPLVAYHLPMSLHMRKLKIIYGPKLSDEDEQRLTGACQDTIPAAFLQAGGSLPAKARQLLDGIRQNGSLHEFTLNDEDVFTPEMNRKAQAYLTRNREVPQLLSRPSVSGDTRDQDGQTDDATTSAAPSKTDLTRFPPLMVAATMAPAMSPTNVLIGLAAASMAEKLGEFWLGGAKRKRSGS